VSADVIGVLLAGGLARRMGGGDKGLRTLGGRPILDHVVARARPQVGRLVLNAPGDPDRFRPWGLPVVADVVPDFAGPLAGVLTGLEWAAENAPEARWVATFATDAPFMPEDLVTRLLAAAAEADAELACARSGGRAHPVFGLWPLALRAALRRAVVDRGIRKIDAWTAGYRLAYADFATEPVDPFFNVNAPADLAEAERLIRDTAAMEGAA
jgi:molybdopterin-guanine dinucleotide biosynthesis protein A